MDVPQQEPEEIIFDETVTSRFTVIRDSVPLPATCSGCNLPATNSRRMIDLGTQIDFYGAVMICLECATSIASLVDYRPSRDLDNLRRSVDYYKERAEETQEKIEALENVVFSYSLSDIVSGRLAARNGDSLSKSDDESGNGNTKEPTEPPSDSDGKSGSKGSRSTKSVAI